VTHEPQVGGPFISPRVLIVDDDAESREMYTVALSLLGFEALSVPNAEEAFAEACAVHPDAVVTDIMLPRLSGLDLARRLRGDSRTTDTGIIVLTGHASESTRRRARAAGCDRFLVKPCVPDALALAIHDVLASRCHMSEAR
jgi:CheY-like chemotaxis protein